MGLIPTADLMKKGLRLPCLPIVAAMAIPTADLMKKGLRRNFSAIPIREGEFQPQT